MHTHAPMRQVLPDGQVKPQAPQLALLACVSTQAPPPVVGLAPQTVWPDIEQTQRPALQREPMPQARPQRPQLLSSDWKFVQLPEQKSGFAMGHEHAPERHEVRGAIVEHTVVHVPQWAASVCGSTQLPPPLAVAPQTMLPIVLQVQVPFTQL